MEDTRTRSSASRIYEDFQPLSEWIFDNTAEIILLIRLPGFSKDQLKVQMDNHGNIRISGERPVGNSLRWVRFHMEHRIPDNANVSGIRARFEINTLYIIFPKIQADRPATPEQPTLVKKPEPEPEPKLELKSEPEPEHEPENKPTLANEPEPEKKLEPSAERKFQEKDEEQKAKDKEEEERKQRDADKMKGKEKRGLRLMARLRKRRQVVAVNMVVAAIVCALIGIYVGYKMSSAIRGIEVWE